MSLKNPEKPVTPSITVQQCIENLRAYKPPPDKFIYKNRAAVLIPLIINPITGDLDVLFIKRADNLKSFPGEAAFPGGRIDPTDENLYITATREAEEEIGLKRSDIELLCQFPPLLTSNFLLVSSFVALIKNPAEFKPTLNPQEVSQIFMVPLRLFISREIHDHKDVDWGGQPYRIHIFRWQSWTILGLTSHLMNSVVKVAYRLSELPWTEYAPNQLEDSLLILALRPEIKLISESNI
ncbi:11965_t:CDS:2 [Ambispora leptoticha]|uniref:11965_t:CDS:1 n=1 Tax=Ambispora leptoticha TaxID=144679 RepID=A0A9N9FGS1_9GLOM|nr:11965_t:CDS:2 [Ambispora leptoticha]